VHAVIAHLVRCQDEAIRVVSKPLLVALIVFGHYQCSGHETLLYEMQRNTDEANTPLAGPRSVSLDVAVNKGEREMLVTHSLDDGLWNENRTEVPS